MNSSKAIGLATLGLAAILALAPTDAHAQRYSQIRSRDMYRLPGTSTRVWPQPRSVIRSGGTTIYFFGNNDNCNPWPYGYSNGYSWPYGYSRGYSWPYGNQNRFDRGSRRRH